MQVGSCKELIRQLKFNCLITVGFVQEQYYCFTVFNNITKTRLSRAICNGRQLDKELFQESLSKSALPNEWPLSGL